MSERRLAFLVRTQSNPGCYVTYRIHNMSHKLQDVVSATIRVLLRRERSIEAMPLGHLRYRIGKSAFPQEPSDFGPGQSGAGISENVGKRLQIRFIEFWYRSHRLGRPFRYPARRCQIIMLKP